VPTSLRHSETVITMVTVKTASMAAVIDTSRQRRRFPATTASAAATRINPSQTGRIDSSDSPSCSKPPATRMSRTAPTAKPAQRKVLQSSLVGSALKLQT
jgi:hypothetical protein